MLVTLLIGATLGSVALPLQSPNIPLLLRSPAIGPKSIVFSFAGDLWSVPRAGGDATRLTVLPGVEGHPKFSPDGATIAFSGQYDGRPDVYVIPAEGGSPKRLTYYPGPDRPEGWTPDGKRVIFSSNMRSFQFTPQLFTVGVNGDTPQPLPFPIGAQASMSPDGKQLAYVPNIKWQEAWKRYRGGNYDKIWIGNLSDSKVTEIPGRGKAEDRNPMWMGNAIYFISDRNAGKLGLWKYDLASKRTNEIVKGRGLDIKTASAGFGAIAYEKLGSIRLFDVATGQDTAVPVTIRGDFPTARVQYKQVGPASGAISPTGARAVIEARGRIVTIPAAKGDAKDLTPGQGVANRSPSWSPDGKTIAFHSDASGEYRIVLKDVATGNDRVIVPGEAPGFYYGMTWSPDSKKVAYTDNKHNLWVLDVASGASDKIDTAPYEDVTRQVQPTWSPDSQWLAWHRDLDTHFNAIFLYGFEKKEKVQLTDGLSNARYPAFDKGGEYLYFCSSNDTGGNIAWLDLSSYASNNVTSSIYAAVLKKDGPDPLAPESDDEPTGSSEAPKGEKPKFRIDLDGIDQRMIWLPIPARNFAGLYATTPGSFLVIQAGLVANTPSNPPISLSKFSLATKTLQPFAQNVQGLDVTPAGDKMLLIAGGGISIVPTAAPPAPGQGAINPTVAIQIDPVAEWKQIFREAVRLQRDFFYDPGLHGQDINALAKRYEPFLDGLKTREDLNYLFTDMMGEISVGHMYVGGGDVQAAPEGVPGGLLGADFEIENGRYRLTRVFNGEQWNPGVRAPLARVGVDAKAGEYIIAIQGKELTDKDNLYQRLENTAGKQISIKLASTPDGKDARTVTVVPEASEQALRNLAWVADNRRAVAKLSGGRLGYVHVPDTNLGGWTSFNRYYFSQKDREAMVIDERFNGGGSADDYFVDQMIRPMMSMWTSRYGKDFASPASANFGPKVLITNEFAGSGGDYFPWYFRERKVGQIVGTRTWGGLVGILAFPPFVDGGTMTSPNIAFYNPDGRWEIENNGVTPDHEVLLDPYMWRQGRDAQLEKAVEVALNELKNFKKPAVKKPAYPDKSTIKD